MNERTPAEIVDQIMVEMINPECSTEGRLSRLERQIKEVFIRLGQVEDAQ